MAEMILKKNKDNSKRFLMFCANNFIWIVIFISLSIVLFGFLFLIKPKYDQYVSSLSEENKKQDQFLFLLRESKDYLDEVRERVNKYNSVNKDDLEKINGILPKCGFHEELFTQMDNIVKKNGLLLTSISIKPEVYSIDSITNGDQEGVVVMQKRSTRISFSLAGVNYVGMKNFLKDIESNLRIMDINSLGFDPTNNSLSLDIQAYCLE
jgi:Tfp pilus assembly protein PilO